MFLVDYGDGSLVKILDFGIAIDVKAGARHTESGTALGTPRYMSPEQAQGDDDVDYRTDLWSLAVIVYRCLCGIEPFRGQALGGVFRPS